MELKIWNFLSTLFWNEDFISQESPILADVEDKVFYWIRIIRLRLLKDFCIIDPTWKFCHAEWQGID